MISLEYLMEAKLDDEITLIKEERERKSFQVDNGILVKYSSLE